MKSCRNLRYWFIWYLSLSDLNHSFYCTPLFVRVCNLITLLSFSNLVIVFVSFQQAIFFALPFGLKCSYLIEIELWILTQQYIVLEKSLKIMKYKSKFSKLVCFIFDCFLILVKLKPRPARAVVDRILVLSVNFESYIKLIFCPIYTEPKSLN